MAGSLSMVRARRCGLLALLLLLAGSGTALAADNGTSVDRAGAASTRSAGQAAEQARRQSGGRVLSTERQGNQGYRVKVLTPQGRVRKIDVPAPDK